MQVFFYKKTNFFSSFFLCISTVTAVGVNTLMQAFLFSPILLIFGKKKSSRRFQNARRTNFANKIYFD